jgi:hypothetical protein
MSAWSFLISCILSFSFLIAGLLLVGTGFYTGDQLRVTNGLLMLILVSIESARGE